MRKDQDQDHAPPAAEAALPAQAPPKEAPMDGLVAADALEEAHREIPDRPWGRIALATLVLTLLLMTGWEVYWRSQGFEAGDIKNNNAAWAEQRRRAVGDATVLVGTSRNLFDVDLDVWQRTTGVRPVQLSLEGTSPRFELEDLANDPAFHGTVITDVLPSLFYGMKGGRGEGALPYYRRETVSQRVGRWLMVPVENAFAYIDDETRPKTLWARTRLPLRPGQRPYLDVYKIGVSRADRNAHTWRKEVVDAAYHDRSIAIWRILFGGPPPGAPPIDPPKVVAEVAANVAKIRARGGEVIFVVHPSGGFLQADERAHFPREVFWFPLLKSTGSIGVDNRDYPELQGFRFPELSHMHPDDAPIYTARLAKIVMAKVAERKAGGAASAAQPNPQAHSE